MPKNYRQLQREYRQWLHNRSLPLAGGDGEEENKEENAGGDPSAEGSGNADDKKEEAEGEEEKEEKAEGDDTVAQLQQQVRDLTDKLNKAEQAVTKAKKEASDAKAEHATKSGNFKELATQREAQLQDMTEERDKAVAERDSAQTELDSFKRQVRVTNIAVRLGFKDPVDAQSLLEAESGDQDLTGDDATAERALRKLAEKKPYLVDPKKATGRATSGSGGGTGELSLDEIRNMSQEEVTARLPEIQKALAKK